MFSRSHLCLLVIGFFLSKTIWLENLPWFIHFFVQKLIGLFRKFVKINVDFFFFSNLELSFEYLMPSGELQWVTIVSSQAILISLCLQTMVEELLR
jgi:hypothetical protein